ncbi:UPF0687 protein C20orf27-like [Silurus asotus]|uniref:UPF0687 protein C20orf27-like n=1 Tax=Silurus asotus TaxID=30991 RepID=A0AAD5AH17_SILAS|nr:UPF0687 protein C20orf27-like [Silurus asotus]
MPVNSLIECFHELEVIAQWLHLQINLVPVISYVKVAVNTRSLSNHFIVTAEQSGDTGVSVRDVSEPVHSIINNHLQFSSSKTTLRPPVCSTSKGGGVHFPDETEDDVLSESGDDTQHDKVITAIAEPDGTYLVKAGFLKIQHKYEIIFLIPQVPTLGKDSMLSPALRATPKPRLRATHIVPCPEGGVKVVCEYSAQQEGVVQDELTLINRSRRDSSVKVRVHARVMDRHHGTPMLLEGVRCLGTEEISSKTNDRKNI